MRLASASVFEKIIVGYGLDQAGRYALILAARMSGGRDGELTVVFPYHALLTP
jgi:hypothetical protein